MLPYECKPARWIAKDMKRLLRKYQSAGWRTIRVASREKVKLSEKKI
jgi:hypothetical protein